MRESPIGKKKNIYFKKLNLATYWMMTSKYEVSNPYIINNKKKYVFNVKSLILSQFNKPLRKMSKSETHPNRHNNMSTKVVKTNRKGKLYMMITPFLMSHIIKSCWLISIALEAYERTDAPCIGWRTILFLVKFE